MVREVISKFIEMEGWRDLKALVDKKYAQALNIRLTGSKIEGRLQPKSKPKEANRTGLETSERRKRTIEAGMEMGGQKSEQASRTTQSIWLHVNKRKQNKILGAPLQEAQ